MLDVLDAVAEQLPPDYKESSVNINLTFTDALVVRGFLQENPQLKSILVDGIAHLFFLFENPQFQIEVITDPEISNYTQLFVYVSPQEAPQEAFEKLREFERTWGLQAQAEAEGKISFSVKYL